MEFDNVGSDPEESRAAAAWASAQGEVCVKDKQGERERRRTSI